MLSNVKKQKVFDELQMAQEYIESGLACLVVARNELGDDKDVPGMKVMLETLFKLIEANVGEPDDFDTLTIHSLQNKFEDTHGPLIWRNC